MPWPTYEEDEIEQAVKVLKSGKVNYWTGDEGRKFEKEFAHWSGNKFGICVSNGTVALELALRGLGITSGDEVIVTPRSFIASCSCVINVGATPVFADIDPLHGNICPSSIKQLITNKTKAIICVHVGGYPCDMDSICEIAKQHSVFVIEDCAQAHGARIRGKSVGSFGEVAAWSFCQDKIISTAGEGGMVTTNSQEIWKKMWAYKDHGKDYETVYCSEKPSGFRWLHHSIGTNWRMTEIQAAIGRVQLKKLDAWLDIRRRNVEHLLSVCKQFSAIKSPNFSEDVDHAYYRLYMLLQPENLAKGWSKRRVIDSLSQLNVKCFDGSCSEIFREVAFQRLALFPHAKLQNAQIFSENSFCFLVDHTISQGLIDEWCKAIRHVMSEASI